MIDIRFAVFLLAVFALAGCNASETPNVSIERPFRTTPVDSPVFYAQTSGFYGGR